MMTFSIQPDINAYYYLVIIMLQHILFFANILYATLSVLGNI